MCLFFTIEILVKQKPAWVDSKAEGGTKERRDGDRFQHIIVNKDVGMASQSLACHSYERFHAVGSPMRLIITVHSYLVSNQISHLPAAFIRLTSAARI